MNYTVKKFLNMNNVNLDELRSVVDTNLYSARNINSIVAKNSIYGDYVSSMVSVSSILGYDYTFHGNKSRDLFDSLDGFFDEYGDGYHSRSVGMLLYSPLEVVDKLWSSFQYEPMKLEEISKDKYTIATNGMHRFSVLRANYLIELSRVGSDLEKIEELNKKYTIPALVKFLDVVKTYANFIINSTELRWYISISSEYTSNYKKTGNVIIKDKTSKEISLNDSQLISYLKEKLKDSKEFQNFIDYYCFYCGGMEDFISFMQEFFPEYLEEGKKRVGSR